MTQRVAREARFDVGGQTLPTKFAPDGDSAPRSSDHLVSNIQSTDPRRTSALPDLLCEPCAPGGVLRRTHTVALPRATDRKNGIANTAISTIAVAYS
jgi:hypothetical protein